MGAESADAQKELKRKYTEFISLLPLTEAIAGLPDAPVGQYFNDGQMENRATAIRSAYKIARELIHEILK